MSADNNRQPTKILGMSKPVFYSVSGVVVFLVGFGLYKVLSTKK